MAAIISSITVTVTKTAGLAGVKVHRAREVTRQPQFDVTGDADTHSVLALGNRQIQVQLECSALSQAATRPKAGDAVTLRMVKDGSDTTTTENYIITDTSWDWDKRGAAPPQRFTLTLSPHAEAASNSAATDYLWASDPS